MKLPLTSNLKAAICGVVLSAFIVGTDIVQELVGIPSIARSMGIMILGSLIVIFAICGPDYFKELTWDLSRQFEALKSASFRRQFGLVLVRLASFGFATLASLAVFLYLAQVTRGYSP